MGGYLKILIEKYGMIEKRLPVLAAPTAKKGRYYLRGNFLRSWLACPANPVSAIDFQPLARLVEQADGRLVEAEGFGLERLVGQLYEERSRKELGDFSLSDRVRGYWDRKGLEIDLIAIDEPGRRTRFGTCKRSAGKLLHDLASCGSHVERFLNEQRQYREGCIVEKVAIAPRIDAPTRAEIEAQGFIAQDLVDLTAGL